MSTPEPLVAKLATWLFSASPASVPRPVTTLPSRCVWFGSKVSVSGRAIGIAPVTSKCRVEFGVTSPSLSAAANFRSKVLPFGAAPLLA